MLCFCKEVWSARGKIPCIAYSGSVSVCVSNVDNEKGWAFMLWHKLIRQLSINYATGCCFTKLCTGLCNLWLPVLHKSLTTTRSGLCIKKQTPSQHLFTVHTTLLIAMLISHINQYHRVAQLVETMCYKPEGRRFDSCCHWNFFLT